ncbi:hypothetical protein GCM10009642_31670 [Nocardiopsis metallicus]|uniref:histidine kinase n=1 Tax=Nocardiopsis metallicus TaxID=179819 RepID=A0A840WLF2_9ACTN|nr:hypothetical protein [Nocardiopsis metallicus]
MAALLSRVPRPTRVDLRLALGLLLLSAGSTALIEVFDPLPQDRPAWPGGYALILAACLPVLWRTAFPRVVALVAVAAATVYYPLAFPDGVVMLSALVMLYTLVRRGYRIFGWLLGPGLFVLLNVYGLLAGGGLRADSMAALAWIIVLICVAEILRWRDVYRRADREREEESARTREEELLRRASDERLRLARDVHDTVAHNISLINVQAGTALYLMESQPERAAEALSTIKQTSKDTLTELRAMLGVLRAVEESAPRAPVPGLDGVPDLVEGARGRGGGGAAGHRSAEAVGGGSRRGGLSSRAGGTDQRGSALGRGPGVGANRLRALGAARGGHRRRPRDRGTARSGQRHHRHG